MDDGLLQEVDQPGEDESVGELQDREAVERAEARGEVGVEIALDLLECEPGQGGVRERDTMGVYSFFLRFMENEKRREILKKNNRMKARNTLNLYLMNTERPPGVSYRFDILFSFFNSCFRLFKIFLLSGDFP